MSVDKRKSGSTIIAALIVAAITGMLITVFLGSISNEVKNTHRYRMSMIAVNLAEAGLEYALACLQNEDWANWEHSTVLGQERYYSKAVPLGALTFATDQQFIKVYIQVEPDAPTVVIAEGKVRTVNDVEVTRQILIELLPGAGKDPTQGGFWGNGVLGRRQLIFGGNKQRVDSFSSSDNPMGHTNINLIYLSQVKNTILGDALARGNGSVASLSVVLSDISVGNADIYGSLATGAGAGVDVSTIVGPNGSIYNEGTELGDESFTDRIDYAYIGYEFYADLPEPVAPTLSAPIKVVPPGGFGAVGAETEYQLSSLTVKANAKDPPLMVYGDVTLVVDGDIDIDGTLLLAPGATLRLYGGGDMTISGNGVVNTSKPSQLQIFNTGKGTEVKMNGNAAVSGAIYAPNSEVYLRGGGVNGVMYGAVVGDIVVFSGNNYDFHYDEDLSRVGDNDGETLPSQYIPEVIHWAELAGAGAQTEERVLMEVLLEKGFSRS